MTKKASKTAAPAKRVVVEVDLTIYTAPEQKRVLLGALEQSRILELDLARVGEIDSAGLQVLLLAKREALAANKELRIVAHSPAVGDLLNFFDVAGYFGDPLVIPAQARG
jgi:anti-sigma B factor antagonist